VAWPGCLRNKEAVVDRTPAPASKTPITGVQSKGDLSSVAECVTSHETIKSWAESNTAALKDSTLPGWWQKWRNLKQEKGPMCPC
jgi:hypothetical protein